MLQQMIQNVLVYVIMINILQGLVSSQSFREIFRFVGGMILIVLCISPVLSNISDTDMIGKYLQERLFQGELDQMKQETALAQGDMENVMLDECRKELERQLTQIAGQQGEENVQASVSLKKDSDGTLKLKKVTMILPQNAVQTTAKDDEKSIHVEDIVIDGGSQSASGQSGDTDSGTRKLKQTICEKYELPGKKVIVWRKSGKN